MHYIITVIIAYHYQFLTGGSVCVCGGGGRVENIDHRQVIYMISGQSILNACASYPGIKWLNAFPDDKIRVQIETNCRHFEVHLK